MNSDNCNPYAGGKIPPCSAFLGNANPIIKDGQLIFTNDNRVYYFITTTSANTGTSLGNSNVITNFQISLTTFFVGLYINEVELGNIKHSDKNAVHSDKAANDFINNALKNKPKVTVDYIPSLSIIVSNTNAIVSVYTSTINISPLNYYILFILNRLENHPGLFFANNSYATEDPINFSLASLALRFPFE